MVRVFVFVTGIALGQFYPDSAAKYPFVLVASGKHTFDTYAMVHDQETESRQGLKMAPVSFAPQSKLRFTAGDPAAVAAPGNMANLNVILKKASVELDANCTGDLKDCVDTKGKPLAILRAEFVGPWKAVAVTDCDEGYPVPANQAALLNFLTPTDSLHPKFPGPSRDGNGFLFYADVPRDAVDDLFTINDKLERLDLIEAAQGSTLCRELGGYDSPPDCVVTLIRNTANLPDYGGGADPHFLPLYSFLPAAIRPLYAEAWLPYGVGPSSCKKGGGCCGYRGCISGLVVFK